LTVRTDQKYGRSGAASFSLEELPMFQHLFWASAAAEQQAAAADLHATSLPPDHVGLIFGQSSAGPST